MTRRLVATLVMTVAIWAATWLVISQRSGPCTPDDLTGCGSLGKILLALLMVLPVVTLVLAIVITLQGIARKRR